MKGGDEQDRHAYAYEYRSMLKSVLKETLRENDTVIANLFKEAIKEWLNEKFTDKTAWVVNGVALILFLATLWVVFHPHER